MIIQRRYPTFSGASGFIPMPRNTAGSEMRMIEELIVAMSMPNVVLDSTTHR